MLVEVMVSERTLFNRQEESIRVVRHGFHRFTYGVDPWKPVFRGELFRS